MLCTGACPKDATSFLRRRGSRVSLGAVILPGVVVGPVAGIGGGGGDGVGDGGGDGVSSVVRILCRRGVSITGGRPKEHVGFIPLVGVTLVRKVCCSFVLGPILFSFCTSGNVILSIPEYLSAGVDVLTLVCLLLGV